MERFNIPRAGESNQRIKYEFSDAHNDRVGVYRYGNQIFIDGTFDGNRRPDFRAIFTPEDARLIADKLNDLADQIEGLAIISCGKGDNK